MLVKSASHFWNELNLVVYKSMFHAQNSFIVPKQTSPWEFITSFQHTNRITPFPRMNASPQHLREPSAAQTRWAQLSSFVPGFQPLPAVRSVRRVLSSWRQWHDFMLGEFLARDENVNGLRIVVGVRRQTLGGVANGACFCVGHSEASIQPPLGTPRILPLFIPALCCYVATEQTQKWNFAFGTQFAKQNGLHTTRKGC